MSVWMKLMCGVISPTGKRNDEENAKEKLFTYATYVPVESFKVRPPYGSGPITFSSRLQGLETVVVDAE